MRVLLIGNMVLNRTTNMGKTFLSYFGAFEPEELAQFYIYSEVPTDDRVCRNYYRFTDWDALRSILTGKGAGTVFGADDIDTARTDARTDTEFQSAVYRRGSKKTPLLHMARNLVWKLSAWKSPELMKWITEFGPDAVFFASGDSLFMYDIAREIAERFNIPLIVSTVDDFYVFNRNEGHLFGKAYFRSFMKTVRRTMDYASCILPICDSMSEVYRKMFSRPCHTLHTPVEDWKLRLNPDAEQISYIGNIDFKRYLQLADIGRALRGLQEENIPHVLDVYSQEKDPEMLSVLTEENGIRFHGAVSAEEVLSVMENSRMVVHTESFDPVCREIVRYSVSTKIAESLMYGPCLFAYGPEGIESMDYLIRSRAAFTVTDRTGLADGLRTALSDGAVRESILRNARRLAKENHDISETGKLFRSWVESCVHER